MRIKSNHIYSESDLIAGCLRGDPKMQRALYDRFAAMMYGVCLRYTRNSFDADDILQEGFIKVFNSLDKFRGEGSFEGWIRRIFINTCIEHFRKKTPEYDYDIEDVKGALHEDPGLNALDMLAVKDLLNIINELAPGYKMVFNLYVVEGYGHKEIAEKLGITEGTSKSQLARAKEALKKILKARHNRVAE